MPQEDGSLNFLGVVLPHGGHVDMDFYVSTYPQVEDNIGCLMFLSFLLLECG